MRAFSAKDAARRFGAVMKAVKTEPVVILMHNRPRCVLISVEIFEEFARLKEAERARTILDGLEAAAERFQKGDGAAGVNMLRKLAPLWRAAGIK